MKKPLGIIEMMIIFSISCPSFTFGRFSLSPFPLFRLLDEDVSEKKKVRRQQKDLVNRHNDNLGTKILINCVHITQTTFE